MRDGEGKGKYKQPFKRGQAALSKTEKSERSRSMESDIQAKLGKTHGKQSYDNSQDWPGSFQQQSWPKGGSGSHLNRALSNAQPGEARERDGDKLARGTAACP